MKTPTEARGWILAFVLASSAAAVHAQDKFQAHIERSAVTRLDQAVAVRRAGDLDNARKLLEQLTLQYPDYYRAVYNLGLAYADAGEPKKAVETLLKADALRKRLAIDDPTLDNSIGWAYLLDWQYAKAEEYFARSLKNVNQLPKSSQARLYNNYAQLKIYQNNYPDAQKYLKLSTAKGSAVAEQTLKQLSPQLAK